VDCADDDGACAAGRLRRGARQLLEACSLDAAPTIPSPYEPKLKFDRNLMRTASPEGVCPLIGDSGFGCEYQRPNENMLELWNNGMAKLGELLKGPPAISLACRRARHWRGHVPTRIGAPSLRR
jgi:hypothetical protein